jgi:hypothetical protein
VRTYSQLYTHIHKYIHTLYIHAYSHTHTHTHTHINELVPLTQPDLRLFTPNDLRYVIKDRLFTYEGTLIFVRPTVMLVEKQ